MGGGGGTKRNRSRSPCVPCGRRVCASQPGFYAQTIEHLCLSVLMGDAMTVNTGRTELSSQHRLQYGFPPSLSRKKQHSYSTQRINLIKCDRKLKKSETQNLKRGVFCRWHGSSGGEEEDFCSVETKHRFKSEGGSLVLCKCTFFFCCCI